MASKAGAFGGVTAARWWVPMVCIGIGVAAIIGDARKQVGGRQLVRTVTEHASELAPSLRLRKQVTEAVIQSVSHPPAH